MRNDAKVKRVIRKYGAEGYALYCYILESIAGNLESKSPIPALEETSEDLAYELKMDTLKVQEIVNFCIDQGLFSQDEITGHILCMKMYKFLDDATRKSAEVVKLLDFYKKSAMKTEKLGQIPSKSEKVRPDKDKDLDLDEDIKNTPSKNDGEESFEKFWEMYGKKNERKKCLAKWRKLPMKTKDLIFEKLPAYIRSTPDRQYRKNPSTYLNNECWNDEIIPVANTNNQEPEWRSQWQNQ